MMGLVEKHLLDKIEADGIIHITLLDPDKCSPETASDIAHDAEESGTAAIMVGGSTVTSTEHLDNLVKSMKKKVKIPIILFPNNVTGISRYADAIWFMSLLNSSDPYFLTGAQVLGAPLIKKFGLEPIPLGYIIIGEGGAVSVIGRACPIPYDKPELAVAYALAAQYFGMRFVYLEAGSGAKQTVPAEMIKMVKSLVDVTLIVGGGIQNCDQVKTITTAGADIFVTGTITEKGGNSKEKIGALIKYARSK
jgi:phosphoglycerol geranylgeranyltransferase